MEDGKKGGVVFHVDSSVLGTTCRSRFSAMLVEYCSLRYSASLSSGKEEQRRRLQH